jgi:hypothetical protein
MVCYRDNFTSYLYITLILSAPARPNVFEVMHLALVNLKAIPSLILPNSIPVAMTTNDLYYGSLINSLVYFSIFF